MDDSWKKGLQMPRKDTAVFRIGKPLRVYKKS